MEADQCPGCGSQLSETLRQPGKPFPRYDVKTIVCAKCEITDVAQHEAHLRVEAIQKDNPTWHPPGGRIWTATRKYPDFTAEENQM